MEFRKCEIDKGVKCIIIPKYRYQRILSSDNISWRFTSKICCVTILTSAAITKIIRRFDSDHNGHCATILEELNTTIIRNACERRAKDAVWEKPMRIMR